MKLNSRNHRDEQCTCNKNIVQQRRPASDTTPCRDLENRFPHGNFINIWLFVPDYEKIMKILNFVWTLSGGKQKEHE